MPTTTAPPAFPMPPEAFPGYGQVGDLGSNWRIKFADADGIPLNMLSFEQIDFGAIAYKEIFQNVKTILATPLYSAALERLIGIDQTIVDLPIDQAAQATIAILDALYFWEPRAEVVNVRFASDVISGHLSCSLQLKVKNVIYGTEQPYDRNNIFQTPTRVTQILPPTPEVPPVNGTPIPGPPGPPGAPGTPGAPGQRGSYWFFDTVDPDTSTKPEILAAQQFDMCINTTSYDIFQFDGTTWARRTKKKARRKK